MGGVLAFPGLFELSQASSSLFKEEDGRRRKEDSDDGALSRLSAAHCIPTQAGECSELSKPLLAAHMLYSPPCGLVLWSLCRKGNTTMGFRIESLLRGCWAYLSLLCATHSVVSRIIGSECCPLEGG